MSWEKENKFIPFFVADRQASLRILRGLDVPDGKKIGIMTHANTSDNFKNVVARFPCSENEYCEIIGTNCPCNKNIINCIPGQQYARKIIKISDSGVFTKEGCMFDNYDQLFEQYDKMKVDYGIMIDYLKDKEETLRSAELALETYREEQRSFKLIGVAQGNSLDEYIECYKELKKLGFEHVAVGGLLEKRENSVRYVRIRNESFLSEVLIKIREIDPDGWIFALGSYAPSRHYNFLETGVQGSDYKGWIFQYTKINENAKKGDLEARNSRFEQVRSYISNNILAKKQSFGTWPKLMILPCSKRKMDAQYKIPAIDRYEGQYFRIIKKYISDFSNNDGFDVAILSAKYGLLQPMDEIHDYDLKMNDSIAASLNESIIEKLASMNKEKQYKEVAINLGKSYFKAIDGYDDIFGKNTELTIFEGKIGERQQQMINWLENISLS
ncbi:peroxide stress protein YaaA [uncultured Methanomethylovorans sp.]|uniref:peroxide stress protein YaaA n=1 Tax=uncultured Methanomethylovorans sp. TaxID=183759 RepID=UPI0026149980|nr:peroxide stress protein YaaA [uncultured Methanomethylovorans sp.]